MTLNDAVVRIFGSNTIATKDENGYWKVITTMTEKVSTDGEHFEEKKIEKMGISNDFQQAFDTALEALLREYAAMTGGSGSMFKELLEDGNTKVN